MPSNFKNLHLSSEMIDNLESIGYKQMTPIQEKTLPFALNGRDVIAKAKTGSGKTAAFGIGLLEKLNVKKFRIQSLVLCPTRELADQVANELRKIARFKHNIKITTLCGGVPYRPQVHSLSHNAHIIVGTPGRILKHLKEGSFSPQEIKSLILDEADRMLDMGFYDDIMAIIGFLQKKRHTLLFSATYPDNIIRLSKDIMIDPVKVEVDTVHEENVIEQKFIESVDKSSKSDAVLKIISSYKPESVLIFCNTKIACDDLADDLEEREVYPLVLHSDMDQKSRSETLILFSNKSYPLLIATDVASRGLDIENIDLVINVDMPESIEVYTHRIGRTARAGSRGHAVSFVQKYEMEIFEEIKEYSGLDYKIDHIEDIQTDSDHRLVSNWETLFINGGKKNKMRAGDILGALTAGIGIKKEKIGKIDILEYSSYVAVKCDEVQRAYDGLRSSNIKGKSFKVYII